MFIDLPHLAPLMTNSWFANPSTAYYWTSDDADTDTEKNWLNVLSTDTDTESLDTGPKFEYCTVLQYRNCDTGPALYTG